jgi:hypothetical protein
MKRRALATALALAAASAVVGLFPLGASGAGSSVTIIGRELFAPRSGQAIFLGTGGPFGSGTVGTFISRYRYIGSPSKSPYGVEGTDDFTAPNGKFTWKFKSTCTFTKATFNKPVCKGTWEITKGSGDYKGASGKGTLLGKLELSGNFKTFQINSVVNDLFKGTIELG